jgi:hypothetical protein
LGVFLDQGEEMLGGEIGFEKVGFDAEFARNVCPTRLECMLGNLWVLARRGRGYNCACDGPLMLKLHHTGDWAAGQVRVTWAPSTHAMPPEVQELIERTWNEISTRPGMIFFDGPMCRLEGARSTPAELDLTFSKTSYKPFFGTNLQHPELADRYGEKVLANPVGVSPALLTADKWLVFGHRNANVAYYPNRIHPFAGALEPREQVDIFQEVRRELKEELEFGEEDIKSIHCTGLVEDARLRQPELIFRVESTRTRDEIRSRMDLTEHHEIWSIPATRAAVEGAMGDRMLLTPIALASMLLWGRLAFGEAWFEQERAKLASV